MMGEPENDDDHQLINHDLREPLLPEPNPQDEEHLDVATFVGEVDETAVADGPDPAATVPSNNNPWKNHNVILSLVLCVFCGTADSVWSSVVLSGFLLALANAMGKPKEGNTLVGSAEACQGLTQLLTALPVGVLADKWGKSKTVRLGGALMLITIAIHLWALVDVKHNAEDSTAAATRAYATQLVALALWGVVDGIAYGPSQALFADSIPTGRRSEMLTWLYTCYLLSSAIGPIVSIILFSTEKDAEAWSISELFPVFFVGLVLEIPAAILMFFFRDKYVVPESTEETSESEEEQHQDDGANLLTNSGDSNGTSNEPELCTEVQPESGDNNNDPLTIQPLSVHPMKAAIPYVLFVSSLVTSLASGASVKYFPLFFKELGFSSAAVQGIFLMVPIFISSFSFVAQKMGKKRGRIEATIWLSVIGISLLYFMTWLSRDVAPQDSALESFWTQRPYRALLIVAVYLLRTGLMNCSYPLLESVLMDSVPSNQRARWKALESIAAFGWTGSALAGGVLSDSHSYQFTFSITATMQLCGGMLLFIIRPFVEAEEGP